MEGTGTWLEHPVIILFPIYAPVESILFWLSWMTFRRQKR